MATAWVAEMGDGDYVSHVELDADHPFATVVNGPTGDDLPGLFAWAREAADEVRLRIGDRTFSAGVEHVEGLPHGRTQCHRRHRDRPRWRSSMFSPQWPG
jgi:hypothetical protein